MFSHTHARLTPPTTMRTSQHSWSRPPLAPPPAPCPPLPPPSTLAWTIRRGQRVPLHVPLQTASSRNKPSRAPLWYVPLHHQLICLLFYLLPPPPVPSQFDSGRYQEKVGVSPRLGKRQIVQQRRSRTLHVHDDSETLKAKQRPVKAADALKVRMYVSTLHSQIQLNFAGRIFRM